MTDDWVRFAHSRVDLTFRDIAEPGRRPKPCKTVHFRASLPPLAGGDAGRRRVRPIPPPIVRDRAHDRARQSRRSPEMPTKLSEINRRPARISITPFVLF